MNQEPTHQPRFWKKLLIRSGLAFVILVVLFLALLPVGTKHYLKQWLLQNGAEEVFIEDININIFSGKANLAGVDIRKSGQTIFSNSDIVVDLNLASLFGKEVQIQKAILDTVTIEIEQYDNGNIRIGSFTTGTETEPAEQSEIQNDNPWIFRTQQLTLSNVTIHYKQPDIELQLVVEKGDIKRFDTDPNSRGGTLFLQGKFDDAPFEVDLSLLRVIPDINVKGTVAISDFKLDVLKNLTKESMQEITGLFSGQGKINLEISEENGIEVSYKGKLGLSEYTAGQDAYTTGGEQVKWDGNISYVSAEQKIDLEGSINGQELHGVLSKPNYQANFARIDIEPKLSINLADNTRIIAEGNLQLENFALAEPEKEDPLIALNTLNLAGINWSDTEGLFINKIDVNSVTANIIHEKSTKQEATIEQQQKTEITQQQKTTAEETKGKLPIRISNIAFRGENRLTFTDNTLSSPFTTSLAVSSFEASGIDTSKPDEPFSYALEGAFDETAPFRMNGSALLFGDTLIINQETQLRNYSLQRVSPYVAETIGNAFDAGQLDFSSTFAIKADTIDSKNNVVLKNIRTKTVDDELNQEFNNLLPVPLDFAFSLLKDGNGHIDLDVPVSGQFSQLNVGLADILTTAFSKAIISGVTPYLAYIFLGPTTGTLAYLGVKATQKFLNAGFPELSYETGISDLSEENKETLNSIGKKIEKEKEQTYTVCARLSLWEMAGDIDKTTENQHKILQDENQQKQLFELGQQRTRNVHTFLLENFNIGNERLLMCDPGLNLDKNRPGTVEILK